MKSSLFFFALVFLLLSFSSFAQAYQLPPYSISSQASLQPAEEVLSSYQARMAEIQQVVPLQVMASRRQDYHSRLPRKARGLTSTFDQLENDITFWTYVVDLKKSLKDLHAQSDTPEMIAEADAMAKIIVQTIYNLSQKYRVTISALVQNMLINTGIKKEGFCYHYVSALRDALSNRSWMFYDLHWGEAWAKTFRENNALVVTARGRSFKTGLAIDAWRTAGKPFWTKVKGDRFPWVENFDVQLSDFQ